MNKTALPRLRLPGLAFASRAMVQAPSISGSSHFRGQDAKCDLSRLRGKISTWQLDPGIGPPLPWLILCREGSARAPSFSPHQLPLYMALPPLPFSPLARVGRCSLRRGSRGRLSRRRVMGDSRFVYDGWVVVDMSRRKKASSQPRRGLIVASP